MNNSGRCATLDNNGSCPGRPQFSGPYRPRETNGEDAYHHQVNDWGRCEQLNTTGLCPTKAQDTAYYAEQSNDNLILIAEGLGITIPLVHPNSVLVPLIIAVLWPLGFQDQESAPK